MPDSSWKDVLAGQMDSGWAREIDLFEGQIRLREQSKIEDKVFAETRLRRGVYGQRYDAGTRHDGIAERSLGYDDKPTKGPETVWDAPGMMRIKLPYGGFSQRQMEVIADLAEEYSDSILHVTTRQDIQLHFVHIEDTPDLMRRLAAVGITTREACGNSVRNVTACPLAGVCHTETFDVSPYAQALMTFLLGHPDVQDFGRKFKPAFSGCEHEACGLVQMHDAGFVAKVVDGKRGFKVVVGGGLGAVPRQAEILSEFTPEEEFLPEIQAVARVFARLGEKANRNRARIKFLIGKLGIEEFRRLVQEERQALPHDDRWTDFLKNMPQTERPPVTEAAPLPAEARPDGFDAWFQTNVYRQRQEGFAAVTVSLPLGDITAEQTRELVDISARFGGDNIRTTVDQNLILRFVSEADLVELHRALDAARLATPGAGTIVDITACPGTDTCKLGIAASRGLGSTLRTNLALKSASLPDAIKDLRIKISGCFNSCSQHHLADIGFYGNNRKVNNRYVPHFQLVVGGTMQGNGERYGLAVGSIPSKKVPELIDLLSDTYAKQREKGERFGEWVNRLGKREVKKLIEPLTAVPAYSENADYYSDWRDIREFSIGDLGIGECAGEVVSLFGIEIVKAESQVFEAQLALDDADFEIADRQAYRAMLSAARSLVRTENIDVSEEPDVIVSEFKKRFFDNERFFDKYAKGKFGQYLLERHATPPKTLSAATASQLVEEAQLFIEAAHACEARVSSEAAKLSA